MVVKVNANTVIDNSGNIPWGDLVGKPAGLYEIISITGASTYYSATFNAGTHTLTFTKNRT